MTQYKTIEHFYSNRSRKRGLKSTSIQLVRVGPRAVDVKRKERIANRIAKGIKPKKY